MKKYLSYALLAFVIFYMLNSPSAAAGVVHSILSDLANWAHDLSVFVDNLNAKGL